MEKNGLAKRIGRKIRALRAQNGITQKRLSQVTGLSSAMLSRMENGQTIPSITTLQRISNTLKVDISYFFQQEDQDDYVVTFPGKRKIVISRSGPHRKVAYELELLADEMKNPFMEPAIVSHVGEEREIDPRVHDGQEFMYVLEGKVKLTLGSKEFALPRGAAAYWNGNIPHKGVSIGKKTAKAIHVHLIPGRWTGTFQYEDIPNKTGT